MNNLKPENKAILLSVLFGAGFWIIDILLDNWLFMPPADISEKYLEFYGWHELYIRGFVFCLFLIFGIILSRVLKSKRSLIETLEHNQEELFTTLYSIGDAVIATDEKAQITHLNPQAEKLTGWNLDEARGASLKKVFHIINEKTRKEIESPANIVLREGKRVHLANHTILIAKNGREVAIADSGSPIFDNQKNIIGVVLVFRDVTEERRRRNLIYDRESRYRGIISHTSEGIFLSDHHGKIIEWNHGNEEITGLKRNEVIGRYFWDIFKLFLPKEKQNEEYHRKIKGSFRSITKELEQGKKDFRMEVELRMPDGSTKFIEQSLFLIPRRQGNWFGNISKDITEEKIRDDEIRQSEEKFSKTFELSPDAIIISRLADGTILDCNDGFLNDFGAERLDIIGKTSKEINLWKNPDDRDKFAEMLHEKGWVHNYIAIVNTWKGEELFASISATIITLNNESCIVTYSRNITDRVNYENKLAAAKDELERKVEDRTAELQWLNDELRHEIVERAKFQTALQRSEENYRSLIEQIPIGIYRTTLDGRFIHANPALVEILGCESEEELYSCSVFDFYFSKSDRDRQVERLKEVSGVLTHELKLQRKDKKLIWVLDIGQVTTSPEGLQIMDGTLQDITVQKEMHFALQESESRYRALFENLMDIYFQMDINGVLINISPSAEIITGYPPQKLTGKNILDYIEDESVRKDIINMFRSKEAISGYVIPFRSASGNIIYLSSNAHFSKDDEGNYISMEGISRDITHEIRSRNHISVLYEISRAINSTQSLDELYKSIHNSLNKIIDTSNFFIALYDKTDRSIRFPYFVDLHDEWIEEISVDLPGSLTAQVVRSGEPLLARPDEYLEKIGRKQDRIGAPARIWLGVPLKIRNEVIGVLTVQSYSDPDLYNEEDIELLRSVSDQIAVAIDRKQSELALNFQFEFLQNLIDTIPSPVFYKDEDLYYQGCNKAFEDFTGFSREQIIGRNVYDIFPHELADVYQNSDKEILTTGDTMTLEYKIIDRDGDMRDAIFYKSCYYDSSEKIAGVVGMFIDITERKIAERQLKEAREQAELIYRVTPSCIYTVNNENVITSWNKRIAELTGYTPAEVTGTNASFLTDKTSASCPFTDVRIEKPLYGFEQNIVTKDGDLRVVSKNIDYLRNAQGEIVGGIISFEDITERKRIEDELAWQANLNLAIADLSKAIISLESIRKISEMILEHLIGSTDSTFGCVARYDKSSGEMVAPVYTEDAFPEDIIDEDGVHLSGKSGLFSLVRHQRKTIISNHAQKQLENFGSNECRVEFEKIVVAPAISGDKLLGMLAIGNPPRNYSGKDLELVERMASLYAVAIQRDMAEQEIVAALEKEQELNELKSRFISMVSHEYRTPLSAIILSTDLLSGYGTKMPDEDRMKHLSRIKDSVKTMSGLLDDIITFNKMDIGKIEVKKEFIDFAKFCSSISSSVQFLYRNKCEIDFTINRTDLLLQVDEKLFRQIITNLLTNACKYSEKGQTVEFTVDIRSSEIAIKVADKGIGIPEEDKEKMFEPFHRARNVGTVSGTGLGLSIVKNSVEAHGGSINFESYQGVGTTFRIRVPIDNKKEKKENGKS